ncbi:MAG: GNAT family N-acetyltransferase [Bacteroidetes bacterium]|nr:GNAT family N-acetyltransferase [Bacteroidota bacterium]
MEFICINNKNLYYLEAFVKKAGDSLKTFRYFDKRPFSIVKDHICTWVIEEKNEVLAYGHLDKENETVWLGIAVADHARGKGLGKKMMQRLMESAAGCGIQKIKLSVDHVNEAAIKLYECFGFHLAEKKETFGFYEWNAAPFEKIVISTLAFTGMKAEEIIKVALEHNFALEFSSGMYYRADMEKIFLEAPVKRFVHNYFPPPEIPFVLNLASANEEIRKRSVEHCVNGIKLNYAAGASFFSAHAGFCIDPKPSELGKELSKVKSFDRAKHWKIFLESIREVLERAKDLPTGFLLENNVLAKMNLYPDGSNPLLNVRAAEMNLMLEEINDPRIGNLVDTAHLKVSSATLHFDLVSEMNSISGVRCIHHSDNDGWKDDNQPFGKNYWFLPLMKNYRHAIHVLEVRKQSVEELKKMEKML